MKIIIALVKNAFIAKDKSETIIQTINLESFLLLYTPPTKPVIDDKILNMNAIQIVMDPSETYVPFTLITPRENKIIWINENTEIVNVKKIIEFFDL